MLVKRVLAVAGLIVLGALAIVLLLGLIPLSSRGMVSQPAPATRSAQTW